MLPIIFQIYSLAFVKHGNTEKLYGRVHFSESVCIIALDTENVVLLTQSYLQMEFGARLKELRTRLNISQKELSEQTGRLITIR